MTESLLSKTVSVHAVSPWTYNCTSKDAITGGFHWIYLSKYFFIASFHASMLSQMFYRIDVPENSAKFTGNRLYQTLLTLAQIFFGKCFNFSETTFLQNTPKRLFFISIPPFSVLRRFCFRKGLYLFNIPSYFRVCQNSWPLGPHTFSTYNKCYWGKKYTCIKNVHGIYFIKYSNCFRKMLRGSKYTRVLNMSAFWIYQGHEYASGSEYARVLNKPEFWISQGSEYTKVLKPHLVLNLPGFWICIWFWICQGSEYVRVTKGSEYVWLCLAGYAWRCLNMPGYAWICQNLPEWLLFYIFPL